MLTLHRRGVMMGHVDSFRGSIGVPPSDNGVPDGSPEQCSLCGSTCSLVWYVVDGLTDQRGRQLEATALARWWEVCADCKPLVAKKAVQALMVRNATAPHPLPFDVVHAFTARARPLL
jgi:hypothetical protein